MAKKGFPPGALLALAAAARASEGQSQPAVLAHDLAAYQGPSGHPRDDGGSGGGLGDILQSLKGGQMSGGMLIQLLTALLGAGGGGGMPGMGAAPPPPGAGMDAQGAGVQPGPGYQSPIAGAMMGG